MPTPGTPDRLPLTANFHFMKNCNFRCDYCYATFKDVIGRAVLSDGLVFELTRQLARRYTKVTLVGGEPTLYRRLPELLAVATAEGALTNIVTNGYLIDAAWLESNAANLDYLTISIDSAMPGTHRALGRATQGGKTVSVEHYLQLACAARRLGIVVKVNTVVTTLNQHESMADLIRELSPERWKLLQAAPVERQNDKLIDNLTPARADFDNYVVRHKVALSNAGIRIVAEPIDIIRGSYVMVDPQGRFFDSTTGAHRYSDAILDIGMDAAFAQVDFDQEKFLRRAGDADYVLHDGDAADEDS